MGDKSDRIPILVEREKTHGPWAVNAACYIGLLQRMEDSQGWDKLSPQTRGALVMLQCKVARIIAGGPHPEHWEDIVGYAELGKESC